MSRIQDYLRSLTRQLYPTGRVFRMRTGGILDRLHKSLSLSEERAYADALSTLSGILPDNDGFTADDATRWEQRLGLIVNPMVDLQDRKLAIRRKMNHPGTIPARENYLYIQQQLQAAGFDVYLYENPGLLTAFDVLLMTGIYPTMGAQRMGSVTMGIPYSLYVSTLSTMGYLRMGVSRMGGGYTYGNKIVNSIDDAPDAIFSEGASLRSTFFIAGPVLGSFATVPLSRKAEFRQLILKLKPVQTVGYLIVNYSV